MRPGGADGQSASPGPKWWRGCDVRASGNFAPVAAAVIGPCGALLHCHGFERVPQLRYADWTMTTAQWFTLHEQADGIVRALNRRFISSGSRPSWAFGLVPVPTALREKSIPARIHQHLNENDHGSRDGPQLFRIDLSGNGTRQRWMPARTSRQAPRGLIVSWLDFSDKTSRPQPDAYRAGEFPRAVFLLSARSSLLP
jgi:hypothetical protein